MSNTPLASNSDIRTAATHVAACDADLGDCATCEGYLYGMPAADSTAIADLAMNMVIAAGVESLLCI